MQDKEKPFTTNKQPEMTNPLDPFGAWRMMRDTSLDNWSKMMIDLVNSEEYSQATSQWLDTYLTMSQPFQRLIEKTMMQVLTGLNMPTRDAVISLAERFTNIEMRLDDLDVRLDEIHHAIQVLATTRRATGTSAKAKEDR